jgi:hypothetical protein
MASRRHLRWARRWEWSRCGDVDVHRLPMRAQVKNSWGPMWGEGGYIRLAMTSPGPGMCGMYTAPSYPTFPSS